jgi:uncharacterized protein YjbI with pentapeptide repeats
MPTLTLFIEDLFQNELGMACFQVYESIALSSHNYNDIAISGSKLLNCNFTNIVFQNCTFWSSSIRNCTFTNCNFINCKFQFTEFTDCNFEASSFENCIWGLTKLQGNETFSNSNIKDNFAFESNLPSTGTRTLNLYEILICA